MYSSFPGVVDKCTSRLKRVFPSEVSLLPRVCSLGRQMSVTRIKQQPCSTEKKSFTQIQWKYKTNTKMEILNMEKSMCVLRSSTCTRAILFILFLPHWYFDGIIDRCENFPMAALIYGRDCRECSPSPHLSKVTSCTFPFSIIFT